MSNERLATGPVPTNGLGHMRIAAISLLAVCGIAAVGWLLAGSPEPAGVFGGSDQRLEVLEQRIAALEATQKENQAQILAQLARISAGQGRAGTTLSPEQLAKREEARVHRQRLRDDPDYLLQYQAKRLDELQVSHQAEPVDPTWSEETSHHVSEVLETSMAQSGSKITTSSVDCRSTQCRISLELPVGSTYEELLMYMSTDLAEALPRSKLVVMPMSDGTQQVHIFAQSGKGKPANPPPRE